MIHAFLLAQPQSSVMHFEQHNHSIYQSIMMQTLSYSIPHNWIVKAKLEQVLLAMDFRDRTGLFSYFISMASIVTYFTASKR